MEVLFQELVAKYPDPEEAKQEGEQSALEKAMMAAAQSMEADSDYEPSKPADEEEEEDEEEDEEDVVSVYSTQHGRMSSDATNS